MGKRTEQAKPLDAGARLAPRRDFPIFENWPDLIYLDNAATTHKPAAVLSRLDEFYRLTYANVHRGVYRLAEEATAAYEEARRQVAAFIGCEDTGELIFTRGTTEGINLAAGSLDSLVQDGDEILVTALEHHSNLIPWQQLCRRRSLRLRVCPVTPAGELDLAALERMLTPRTRVAAFAMVSNALGTVVPAVKVIAAARQAGAVTVVDAAQAVPCLPVAVGDLGCDFLVFSGHKMLGPMGIGVLYGRREILEKLPPYMTGGEMISRVGWDGAQWAELPQKFEAGTPNAAGAVGLAAAVRYLEEIGMDRIRAHETELGRRARELLGRIPGVRVLGCPAACCGIVSFVVPGIHPHDLAQFLARENIAVRAGRLCAQPLLRTLGVEAVTRVSFYVYNDLAEVEKMAEAVEKGIRFFKAKK
ncbi:MAG TPA: cysteine desulfurase [Kiritimatiellae bacterium]|nr:cysteine desulfurase [Kiritimatiellia bacterium]